MSAVVRMIALLEALDPAAYRERPAGVGQKTINLATEAEFITSRRSSQVQRLPDLHRLTPRGAAALTKLKQVQAIRDAENGIKPQTHY